LDFKGKSGLKKFEVKLEIVVPLKATVVAGDESAAYLMAEDLAMDQLENKTTNSRAFDTFWEYDVNIVRRSCCEKDVD